MSIPNKERFEKKGVKIPIEATKSFPPQMIVYEDLVLTCLGTSNKTDLMPVNYDTIELRRTVTFGSIGQYIYTSEKGDLYDVCVYKDEFKDFYIHGIGTRQKPDKERRKKE